MIHIDENTLELFVLGDEKVRRKEKRIKRHLTECRGCRRLYQDIKSFYEEVEREGKSPVPPISRMTERSLVRKRNELEPYFVGGETEAVSYSEVSVPSVWKRMNRFRREHPVRSTIAMFAFAFVLAAGARYLLNANASDLNPAYVQINTNRKAIDVFNSKNDLLWSLPVLHANSLKQYQADNNAHETIIADLDGNGANEVITTAPVVGGTDPSPVRVYDRKGKLVNSRTFDDSDVSFDGVRYYSSFNPEFLFSERINDGTTDLFVYVDNGRSPSFLARIGPNLHMIGKYWHYGDFIPYPAGPVRNGTRTIVLTGVDDMSQMSGKKFEFVSVLDPEKLVGNSESIMTPGFGLTPSSAEMYYIRLPKSSIQRVEATGGGARVVPGSVAGILEVQQSSPVPPTQTGYWGFNYFFSMDNMSVQDVKYDDPTAETFQMLKKQAKVSGDFDVRYLQNLKNAVRYWNGRTWVKEPTRIEHSPDTTNQNSTTS